MAVVAEANGYGGSDPWRRHLPWPWRPDADNPDDDHDAGHASLPDASADVDRAPLLSWPLAERWRGRAADLALPPSDANPIAPLRLRTGEQASHNIAGRLRCRVNVQSLRGL